MIHIVNELNRQFHEVVLWLYETNILECKNRTVRHIGETSAKTVYY